MRFERFDLASNDWSAQLDLLPERVLCHSPAWLSFLQQSQHGEPVAALLMEDGRVAGAFAGMIVRKLGMRILGSPFPGWTTPYMGLNLAPGVSRGVAMGALTDFAFGQLGCIHLEIMDRNLDLGDLSSLRYQHRMFATSEVDLGTDPDALIRTFSSTCRRYIRKAAREGLVVEEARDAAFGDDYYEQLTEVFKRQSLVPTYPRERVQLLLDTIPEDQVMTLRVRTDEGVPAATGIFHAIDAERAYLWGVAARQDLISLHPNELLLFDAMNRLRVRGFNKLDLGGSGAYKQKYHPRPSPVPWVRISKYPVIPQLREAARRYVEFRQHARGVVARRSMSRAARAGSSPAEDEAAR